jgi:hypothetical protein
MARRRDLGKRSDTVTERLLDLLIVSMALAGVSQHAIRKVAGCDMNRVVGITRHLKPWTRRPDNGRR